MYVFFLLKKKSYYGESDAKYFNEILFDNKNFKKIIDYNFKLVLLKKLISKNLIDENEYKKTEKVIKTRNIITV